MIRELFKPHNSITRYIKEYLVIHMKFDGNTPPPVKVYPVNPEEGITFQIQGNLIAESPELNYLDKRPTTYVFGLPGFRQNFHLSQEFLLIHIRFQPGSLFKLLRIPMNELVHRAIDAELIFGKEINDVADQLSNRKCYESIPVILDSFFMREINRAKYSFQPFDEIVQVIHRNPQGFQLTKIANEACLSVRQFEKRFVHQVGITPKYFARICRFYQAYVLKELVPALDWLSIAVQTGYSDYQHLVKDFKQFGGAAPNSVFHDCEQNPESRLRIPSNFVGL